jgi:cobalt-zinc-cadmium efflux system outer membrane protein
MNSVKLIRRLILISLAFVLAGCTVHPQGEQAERSAAKQAGQAFEKPIAYRNIIPLPADPTPDQLVQYALLNSAALEQRYWEWRAAIEQIPQAGTQSTPLNLVAGTSITGGHASWASDTLALGNDPMTDIKWPAKLDAAASLALEKAKAAGERFLNAKYDLRYQVLSAYDDYALTAELIRLAQSDRELLKTAQILAASRNRTGGVGQQDVLRASNNVDISTNDIGELQSQLPGERAAINALLSRPADAALAVPRSLPQPQPLRGSDDGLIALAGNRNSELAVLAHEVRGQREGVRLARFQYIPDFNFSAGTDLMGVTQSVLGQATVPFLRYEALNAAIAQANADLHAAEAARRQAGDNLSAQVTADIAMIRDADRQIDLFNHVLLPRVRQTVAVDRSAYETGHAPLLDLLDDQRSVIPIERLVANLETARDKRIAELESIIQDTQL